MTDETVAPEIASEAARLWNAKAAFDAGFVLDGLAEPAFPNQEHDSLSFDWENYHQIPPVLVARCGVLHCSTMRRISVRELRQNASQWLREVKAGATFEVTDRGTPVALLGPLPQEDILTRLIREGRATEAEGDLLELGLPLDPIPGLPLPSEVLEQMRADER